MSKKSEFDNKSYEDQINRAFLSALFKHLEGNDEERMPGIHVSNLVYPCMRRAYYNTLMPSTLNIGGAIRIWTGVELHKLPLANIHELTLNWSEITGTIDEYIDGYFIDKKTTRNIPTKRVGGETVVEVRDHHITQLEYYRILLEENNYPVKAAAVLYINVDDGSVMSGAVNILSRKSADIKQEMLSRATILKEFLNARKLPPYNMDTRWMCLGDYCPHINLCMMDKNPVDFLKEEYIDSKWHVEPQKVSEALKFQ